MTIEHPYLTDSEMREAITPRVLPETAERLRSIAEREKTSIGKVIDAWAKSQP